MKMKNIITTATTRSIMAAMMNVSVVKSFNDKSNCDSGESSCSHIHSWKKTIEQAALAASRHLYFLAENHTLYVRCLIRQIILIGEYEIENHASPNWEKGLRRNRLYYLGDGCLRLDWFLGKGKSNMFGFFNGSGRGFHAPNLRPCCVFHFRSLFSNFHFSLSDFHFNKFLFFFFFKILVKCQSKTKRVN